VKPSWLFLIAVAVYLPTVRYGFVQDDRVIVANNPAVHSLTLAVRGFTQPYWPPPNEGGLYRPVTILSFAVDWALGGGRAWLFHLTNAFLHGLAVVLVALVLAPWLPPAGAVAAALVFALHPVHVEAVAGIVGRSELLATVGILGGILAARRGRWVATVACAALAMFSKEYGVVAGPLILVDDWLRPAGTRRPASTLYVALVAVTLGFLAAWFRIGGTATSDVAAPFYGGGTAQRLAIAFPAIARAARLLVWPVNLSADYGPQVIPIQGGVSLEAVVGAVVAVGVVALAIGTRRRWPAITAAAIAAVVCYLPTSNLLFPSGVVLTERSLYVPVLLVAVLVGYVAVAARTRWGAPRANAGLAVVAAALTAGLLVRLPSWRDNRTFLLTLLADHPEAYHAHASAAAVLAGLGDTASARREYAVAESLFAGDSHVAGAQALYLAGLGDTAAAERAAGRARALRPHERDALRAQFLVALARHDSGRARALADTAARSIPGDEAWYRRYFP
jgi:hypothetical protein